MAFELLISLPEAHTAIKFYHDPIPEVQHSHEKFAGTNDLALNASTLDNRSGLFSSIRYLIEYVIKQCKKD